MFPISLQGGWTDIRESADLSGTLILQNLTSSYIFIYNGVTPPDQYTNGTRVLPLSTIIINPYEHTWVFGSGKITITPITETHASDYLISDFPQDTYTTENESTRRIKTEQGSSGFFEGREFRLNRRFTVNQNETLVIKFESPIPFILKKQQVCTVDGTILFRAYRSTGGIESGTFTSVKNILPNYQLGSEPLYDRQTIITSGGIFTPTDPDDYTEIFRVKSSGSTAHATTIEGGSYESRGLPAGIYYLTFHNDGNSNVNFIYTIIYEERL